MTHLRDESSGELFAPATAAQRLITQALTAAPHSAGAWSEARTIEIHGPLRSEALIGAVDDLVRCHETLRSTWRVGGLSVGTAGHITVPVVDLSAKPDSQRAAQLGAALHAFGNEPFDLERGPLFRALLVRVSANHHVLGLSAHACACDGWSFGVLIEDLIASYGARFDKSAQLAESLPAAPSFVSFSRASKEADGLRAAQQDLAHWQKTFADAWPTLDLPIDRARPVQRSFASQRVQLRLSTETVKRLKGACGRASVSLFSALCGAYAALLARLSGNTDVVIAVPAAGQLGDGLDRLVGQCASNLPLRLGVDFDALFWTPTNT
jgi:Condensation domain